MPTYHKVREDGRSLYIDADSPEDASRILKEKNLALRQARKDRKFKAGPDYQPGEVLEKEDIGFMGSVMRGGLNGLVSIPTNITSTIGYGLQAAGAEEVGSELVDRAKAVQSRFAPDVEGLGLAAEVPKALVQFGLPAYKVFQAVKGASTATKVAATAAAEGLVAEEDMKTFGDDYLPNPLTKTQELEFLNGQERAFAALLNKGKVGLEAAALTAGIPLALTGAGAVIKTSSGAIAKVPGVREIADGVYAVGEVFGDVVDKAEKASPAFKKGIGYFKFKGDLPDEATAELKALNATRLASMTHANTVAFKDLNDAFENVAMSGKENGFSQEQILKALDDAINPEIADSASQNEAFKTLIEADKALGFVKSDKLSVNTKPDQIRSKLSLFRSAKNVRGLIDDYSKTILDRPEFLPEGAADTIAGQLGMYQTRAYRAFVDKDWMPDQDRVNKAMEVIREANARQGNPIPEAELPGVLRQIIDKKQFSNATLSPEDLLNNDTLKGVMSGPLKNRTVDNQIIRDFLGEYTAKRGTFLERKEGLLQGIKETTGRQSAIIAKGKYFKELEELDQLRTPENKMFLDNLPESDLLKGEYEQIPSSLGYGNLSGKYVKREFLQALEKQAMSMPFENVPVVNNLYASLLGLKGISQLAQTVYNPTGQIRNALSAAGFAIANGNVPNGKMLGEAYQAVASDFGNKFRTQPERKKVFEELQEKGLIQQQAQLKELEDLIDIAAEKGVGGIVGGTMKFAQRRQNGFSARLYNASDGVWRVFNYLSEKKKLAGMIQYSQVKNQPFNMKANTLKQMQIATESGLDPNNVNVTELAKRYGTSTDKPTLFDEFIDDEAALITRNVVPNYSRVPAAVQFLRQTPLGNFIAYPAELIRTSGNIMGQAIKEIASENPMLRQRGIERLMGFGSMTVGIPQASVAVGLSMTGSSEDQLAAYKRSGAAPWDENGTLIPVKTDKDGNIEEVINGSYFYPYDYLSRPFKAVLNEVANGERKEETLNTALLNGLSEAFGEFFEPFFGESIITERVADVLVRDGERRLGGRIYEESDEVGDKAWAIGTHIVNGIIPPFIPQLNSQESIFNTWNYDAKRSIKFGDLTQSVLVETTLLDPRYRVSERGEQLDFFSELGQAATGVKTLKTDMEKSLYYKAQEAKADVAAATIDFRKLKRASGPRIPEEALYKFQQANERKYKALRDLSVAIDDSRLLGVKENKIAQILGQEVGGVADWRAVMNHVFVPYKPPPSVYAGAYEASKTKVRNILPLREMTEEIGATAGQRFPAAPPPEPRPAPLLDRIGETVRETTQSMPSLFDRASRVLREEEERKLLGGE